MMTADNVLLLFHLSFGTEFRSQVKSSTVLSGDPGPGPLMKAAAGLPWGMTRLVGDSGSGADAGWG